MSAAAVVVVVVVVVVGASGQFSQMTSFVKGKSRRSRFRLRTRRQSERIMLEYAVDKKSRLLVTLVSDEDQGVRWVLVEKRLARNDAGDCEFFEPSRSCKLRLCDTDTANRKKSNGSFEHSHG